MAMTRLPEPRLRRDGQSIPKDRYISREFADLEAERLWPRVWQVACREEEIPNVGDYVEYTITDQSILVTRSAPDEVKAYYNTCLHRGRQLRHGCGNAKELRCRYHSWRWNLDGTIKEVTDAHDFDPADLEPDCLRLPETLVDTWGGFVFINMDLEAEPLLTYLGPVADLLAPFRYEQMRYVQYRTTIMPANWKTALDAFNEGYHTVGTHPQLLRYMDDTNWTYEQFDLHSRYMPCSGGVGRPSPRLGADFNPPRQEIMAAMWEEFSEVGFYDEEAQAQADAMLKQLLEMVEALPEETSLSDFMAGLRRQQAAAESLDLDGVSDDDLLGGQDWNIFPNIMTPMNALSGNVFRFRPNGSDPESCIWDLWTLQRFPEGGGPQKKVTREYYEYWREHDAWGKLIQQDLRNIPDIQKGMHSRTFERLICGRQDGNIVNFHRALMRYIGE
jgi:nitrite reductase/ring-hydroxylating ferredoxin subunit